MVNNYFFMQIFKILTPLSFLQLLKLKKRKGCQNFEFLHKKVIFGPFLSIWKIEEKNSTLLYQNETMFTLKINLLNFKMAFLESVHQMQKRSIGYKAV